MYSHDHEHLLARRSPDWYTRWPSSSSSTEGGRGLYLGRRIDIGACQELDPIAGRGPAVFGIPCSRQSDSVTGRAGRRCHISRVEAPLGRSMGRQVTSAVSTWPSDARQVAVHHQPIAIHRAIHHRCHHHRESTETRVTRGRGHVCKHGTNVRVCRWG